MKKFLNGIQADNANLTLIFSDSYNTAGGSSVEMFTGGSSVINFGTPPQIGAGITLTIGTSSSNTTVNGTFKVNSSITGNSFIKSGGTSSQYLMADGSVSTGTNGNVDFTPQFLLMGA